jgi:single-strand DNA-binding protein
MLKLQLIGHLGQDAQIKQVNDTKVINFSVAHTERFKNQEGQQVEKTIWVNCQLWTDNTKMAEYLSKGRSVYVEGYPSANMFTNKEGIKMCGINCRVTNVQFIGKNTTPKSEQETSNDTSHENDIPSMEDSPF